MKLLRFRYEMTYTYDSPINGHYFSLKCIPGTDCRQKIKEFDIAVSPYEYLSEEMDQFGNKMLIGNCIKPHESFRVLLTGLAESGVDIYECKDDTQNIIMRNQSPYTIPGDAIRTFYEKHDLPEGASAYERTVNFMRKLHEEFAYEKGVTDIHTTAEEAMKKGGGVCQDYAHILLSLLRIAGIPCRYVVGMMTGEGFSHAWVEVFCKGFWYGLDATNNLLVSDEYIKISHGRDYGDCIVNKGIYKGNAREEQRINVVVEVV